MKQHFWKITLLNVNKMLIWMFCFYYYDLQVNVCALNEELDGGLCNTNII